MNTVIGSDDEYVGSVRDLIEEMCASNREQASMHERLSVSSMLVSGISEVSFCSSDYISEREFLMERAMLAFRAHGVDPSMMHDPQEVGYFTIEIQDDEDADDVMSTEYMVRREYMYEGLRFVLNGWARNRDRVVLVSFHTAQSVGIDGDDRLLYAHVHVIYERIDGDPVSFMQDEISDMVNEECNWDSIGESLGLE